MKSIKPGQHRIRLNPQRLPIHLDIDADFYMVRVGEKLLSWSSTQIVDGKEWSLLGLVCFTKEHLAKKFCQTQKKEYPNTSYLKTTFKKMRYVVALSQKDGHNCLCVDGGSACNIIMLDDFLSRAPEV